MTEFICSKCGACCSHLYCFHGIYDDLDRGDGVCRYFGETTRMCNIYEIRPLRCRVTEGYTLFKDHVSWDEYIKQVYEGCEYLRSQ